MKCCARCRTPYNCANRSCICHAARRENADIVRAWSARYQETPNSIRYTVDRKGNQS